MVMDIYLWIQHLQPCVGVDGSSANKVWSQLFQDIQTIFRTAIQLQTQLPFSIEMVQITRMVGSGIGDFRFCTSIVGHTRRMF